MRHLIFCMVVSTLTAGIAAEAVEYDASCDVNSDGVIDQRDIFRIQQHWHARDEVVLELPGLPVGAQPLVLVRIPAGSFQMGSDDPGWSDTDELPVHTVNIGYDFYLGKYAITQAQWEAVMGSNPSYFSSCGNDCPVETVSWEDCREFINALNGLGQGTFRIPSEAEWEYACRAGTTTRCYFGNSSCNPMTCDPCDLDAHAWWCGNNAPFGTKAVGQKLPNPFALYDMYGNLWEWCEDDDHSSYEGAPANGDPWVDTPRGPLRVLRGGHWSDIAKYCRSAARSRNSPTTANGYLGLRVARTP